MASLENNQAFTLLLSNQEIMKQDEMNFEVGAARGGAGGEGRWAGRWAGRVGQGAVGGAGRGGAGTADGAGKRGFGPSAWRWVEQWRLGL